MKFFTVTHPILGTNIKQNGRRYPGALGHDVDAAIPVPKPTPAITRSQAILYSFQSSLIRSITKARSLGMFGTAKENQEGLQKSQGFVDLATWS
jgi:hypothetical protein